MSDKAITWKPGQPLPRYANRKTVAEIISHHYFPISPRTLQNQELWPLTYYKPNRAVVIEVAEAMAVAKDKMKASGAEL